MALKWLSMKVSIMFAYQIVVQHPCVVKVALCVHLLLPIPIVALQLYVCMYYPGQKKRTIIEIRGEKNAVPGVISCSIRRDQHRANAIRDCPRLLPCADRA